MMIFGKQSLALLILLSLLLCACQSVAAPAQAASGTCDIAGAYIGTYSGGPWDDPLIFQSQLVPLDPAGERLSYTVHLVNPDATFKIPPFSETDRMTDPFGEAVRTGPDTYDISLISYGVNEREGDRGEILFVWTIVGTLTCEDNAITDDVIFAVYAADQDSDKDGLPDEGAETIFCNGGSLFNAVRQPIFETCELPPEEEAVIVTDAADLVGIWLGVDFDFYHQFNADGTLRAALSSDMSEENTVFTGEYWLEDGQLYMKEVEVFDIPECGEDPAIYEAYILPSGNLSLTKVVDDCEPRVEATNREHTPVR